MSNTATRAREETRELAQDARQELQHVKSEAKEQAGRVLDDARQQVREQVDAQMQRVAGSIQNVTSELRALCEGRPEEATSVRRYLDDASSSLDRLAATVEQRGFEGILEDVQQFARRRPGTFLAGAAVAGFLAGRLLRSTKDERDDEEQRSRDPVHDAMAPVTAPLPTGELATPPVTAAPQWGAATPSTESW